jgi:hypothetical protein
MYIEALYFYFSFETNACICNSRNDNFDGGLHGFHLEMSLNAGIFGGGW